MEAQPHGARISLLGIDDPYAFAEPLIASAVADDLIGLRDDDGYLDHLQSRYSARLVGATKGARRARVRRLMADDVPAMLERAARKAEQGYLSAELAPYLERIRRQPGGPYDVPGLVELAAWCLEIALAEQRFTVETCPKCQRPWLRPAGRKRESRYCRRRAPGSKRLCREVGKVEDFRSRQAEIARTSVGATRRIARQIVAEELGDRQKEEK